MSTETSHDDLVAAARAQLQHAYAPYSHFDTGAAVLTDEGDVVTGAIVENVSLGLAMCAERVALFATAAGGRRPVVLALAAPDTAGSPTWPCGACLQVALELGGAELVVVVADDEASEPQTATVGELLPNGPKIER